LDNVKEGWTLLEKILLDGKKILLVVDCDVDGLTSSAIIY
jgi:single-stranded DNA-specific DHH superfamily exonuclease